MMRIALFAGGEVGLQTARIMCQHPAPPVALIIDSADREQVNQRLLDLHNWSDQQVFTSDQLAEDEHLSRLRSLNIDFGVLAWWPYLVRSPLLELPEHGFLNFHPSFLPHCRGKDPNFWALAAGEPFGVTIHWIDAGVDSGDIAFQSPIDVSWEDTGRTLYDRARRRIVDLFAEHLGAIISGEIPRRLQDPAASSFHRRSELHAASQIHLEQSMTVRQLLNLLRARTFAGHPGCWFEDDGQRYEVSIDIHLIKDRGDTDGR